MVTSYHTYFILRKLQKYVSSLYRAGPGHVDALLCRTTVLL